MGDGRALQAGTSHNLGQNFAKAFDITFQARDKSVQHVWGTSWGVTTRLVGARDHDPRRRQRPGAAAARRAVPGRHRADRARQLARDGAAARAGDSAPAAPAGIRVTLDERDERPGWKFSEWELRGVPLRLEIGPKDIEKSQVLLARRDTREKIGVPMDGLADDASRDLLDDIQQTLLERALQFREEHTQRVASYDEFKTVMEGRPGFVIAPWCGSADCEAQIKTETQATIRNMPLGSPVPTGHMRPVRRRRDRRGLVRESVLTGRRAGRPQLLQQRRIALVQPLDGGVAPRQAFAADDRAERLGEMAPPPSILC